MATYTSQQLGIKAPAGGFQTGGWYNGRQYWNGTLSDVNVIHPESGIQGAGKEVSAPVVAASNPAQGKAPGTNEAYLASQKAKIVTAPAVPSVPAAPVVPDNGGVPVSTDPNVGGGGTTAPGGLVAGAPSIDLQKVYESAYKTPEIDASNRAISDAQAEIDKTQAARDAEVALINDNPLYSSGRMAGRQSKVDSKYSNDLTRLQNAKTSAMNDLALKKADAEVKVNLAMKQYDINNQNYKDQVSMFNNLLSQGALTNASGAEIASYAVATGIPASMISSIVSKQKQDNVKPTVINSTDDAGNVTVSIIDQNTGQVIGKTSLGNVGKATKSTTKGGDTNSPPKKTQLVQDLGAKAKQGVPYDLLLSFFSAEGLDPKEVYKTYSAVNYYGRAPDNVDPKTGLYK